MRPKGYTERLLAGLFLGGLSLGLAFILAEVSARLFLRYLAAPEQVAWYASIPQLLDRPESAPRFSPHRYLGYVPTPGYRRGSNQHGSLGFRGAEFARAKPESVFRVVCLGGSTVYSDGVDDVDDSYPRLLQTQLSERGYESAQVINAGVSGYGTLETLINFQTRVLDLDPDLVIVYHGFNDVHPRLVWPPETFHADNSGHNGLSWNGRSTSVWEHSTVARMAMLRFGLTAPQASLRRAFGTPPTTSRSFDFWTQVRDGRYPEGVFQTTPASQMLAENGPGYFERNIRSLVEIAAANEIVVVLATFAYAPSAVSETRLATPEYQGAAAQHNDILRSLASDRASTLLDLAKIMPDDAKYFVDGFHFSALGNGLRARHTADHLLDNALLPAVATGTAR